MLSKIPKGIFFLELDKMILQFIWKDKYSSIEEKLWKRKLTRVLSSQASGHTIMPQ